jgi:hypothetical protein
MATEQPPRSWSVEPGQQAADPGKNREKRALFKGSAYQQRCRWCDAQERATAHAMATKSGKEPKKTREKGRFCPIFLFH